ncbi:P-loop containing nucleoside triphosphate hydrolase protein [Microstroma glucosiphilum]|uniref:P-loop containing nucleoside triphosphate hydrolase protein n=1 Tax=Pseudomicrostroma glucosiphilum TaxID=1684307 RepID=A0A316UBV3_9BASI|nr:P-loop containing nucleoside triphosphate hydrolase protein [Pseudomicrostroma glucosiphilum]PWN21941.1 P-loop containing nucleoside triphosphate hydrolase protein [Pseudomicrostroma glucosiphilum]
MLDNFTVLHTSGIVLWSKSFTPTFASNSPIGPLVRTAFIESRSTGSADDERYDVGGYSCRWSLANDYGLAFVAVHQRILHLAYVPALLAQVRALFLDLFKPFLGAILANTKPIGGGGDGSASLASKLTGEARARFAAALKDWDAIFTSTLRKLEREANLQARSAAKSSGGAIAAAGAANAETPASPKTSADKVGKKGATPSAGNDDQAIAKNIEALKARLKGVEIGPGGSRGPAGTAARRKMGSRVSSGVGTPGGGAESPTASPGGKKKGGAGKEMRKWDANGNAIVVGDVGQLDFSNDGGPSTPADEREQGTLEGWVDEKSLGKVGQDGLYEVADALDNGDEEASDEEEDEEDEEDQAVTNGKATSGGGFLSGLTSKSSGATSLFSRLTGSGHSLTQADLQPTLAAMQSHLQSKNVAADVAQRLCASVGRSLEGKTLSTFGSVKKEVRLALEDAITRVLTPRNSTDLLLEINDKLGRQASKGDPASTTRQPYALAFVGVNGVGKSTNLAKVCFWLLQNQKRVLIAACDTFRSGAVEQLRVHVRNLGELNVGGSQVKEPLPSGGQKLELYERGYGKDAAGIAASALSYARAQGFDVVLIDTAGRMQDNEPLMRSLAKLVATNEPDRVIFVGEALVGNEAVDQLTRFDKSLRDFSGKSAQDARGLDGMLLTKFDTIDDKVGTALTATSVTGLPIYFVGVGQTYTDLKQLKVKHIVNALMRD